MSTANQWRYSRHLDKSNISTQIRDVWTNLNILVDSNIAKVSLVGVGMRTHAGIASEAFKALAENDVNIQMISTSEIKITIVINEVNTDKAVKCLHDTFNLDK